MNRIPEPELMDTPEQTRAYAAADFSEPNGLFCQITQAFLEVPAGRLLDLGCGSGGLLVDLATAVPDWLLVGVDAGPNMLSLAETLVSECQLSDRVTLIAAHLPTDVPKLKAIGPFDAIVSNSLLHHLEDPMTLWQTIDALVQPGMRVVVMDLARPQSKAEAEALVEAHTQGADPILQQDFYNSLLAAWRVDEIETQLATMGWHQWRIQTPSNRHWALTIQF